MKMDRHQAIRILTSHLSGKVREREIMILLTKPERIAKRFAGKMRRVRAGRTWREVRF